MVLDMDKLPQGYKTLEAALIQNRHPGSSHAKDLLHSRIHKATAEDPNQELEYIDEAMESKLTG